ncbi:hypothetical protein MPTK1_4g08540 [Marchantia polymorpha subsp. ruderalis]|uniref:Macro domain-containing protein n=2 Tax=Marchantia polymorpha TaxID=3197 RepID=A0AAF6B7S9_MARPO|nr:hypothetical protein MARPO_0157s0024 [Marchantia polymorpha]BBN08063.1 hypothetical protein Mp_4g08540 [Marchantia polymorpha subsp. ruderalis]|eukprot:PTQ28692.1 hypothetical protein MARPO_0157s0024 [Marchantia polymorpha]
MVRSKICNDSCRVYFYLFCSLSYTFPKSSIHASDGPELRKACLFFPSGFRLKVSKIIHTVGPIYPTNKNSEQELRKAYRSSMALAAQNDVKYIAFPAISCGLYQYPLEKASVVALSAVREGCAGLEEVNTCLP